MTPKKHEPTLDELQQEIDELRAEAKAPAWIMFRDWKILTLCLLMGIAVLGGLGAACGLWQLSEFIAWYKAINPLTTVSEVVPKP